VRRLGGVGEGSVSGLSVEVKGKRLGRATLEADDELSVAGLPGLCEAWASGKSWGLRRGSFGRTGVNHEIHLPRIGCERCRGCEIEEVGQRENSAGCVCRLSEATAAALTR
jgi:hypothetical protein